MNNGVVKYHSARFISGNYVFLRFHDTRLVLNKKGIVRVGIVRVGSSPKTPSFVMKVNYNKHWTETFRPGNFMVPSPEYHHHVLFIFPLIDRESVDNWVVDWDDLGIRVFNYT